MRKLTLSPPPSTGGGRPANDFQTTFSSVFVGTAIVASLFLYGCSDQDEIDAESAAILRQVPLGTAFKELPDTMQRLGFSCISGQRQFKDPKGNVRDGEAHLSCEREERHWLACTKRTRAILLQFNGRLSNVLVNVGRFCP